MNYSLQSPPVNSVQQTIRESILTHRIEQPITGFHRRFELPDDEGVILDDGQYKYIVLNFSDVENLIHRDGTLLDVLEPNHVPVILGTEDDEILDERTLQDELDLLTAAQPAIYVPDVVYNYKGMDDEIQQRAIDAYLHHIRSLQHLINKSKITIRLLPTNKGWTFDHFSRYRDLYEELGYREIAFYAVQYTGGDAGNARRILRTHISNAIAALDLENVFVIGRQAVADLLRFDPEVNGACALRIYPVDERFTRAQRKRNKALFANSDEHQRSLNDYQ